jgi:N-acyl-D-amino-acid deacylase
MNAAIERDPPDGIVIENCRIVDGSGGPARPGAVGIRGSVIDAVDRVDRRRFRERIDAEGLVLAPGFIDAHIHTDATLLREPVHLASLYQGVTTHIVGQDGFGFAPTTESTFRFMASYTAGINGTDLHLGPGGIAEFLTAFDGTTTVNVATLIPNGCVRMDVLGSTNASADPPAVRQMARLCRRAMDEGALGLSSGLDYTPSCHASTEELTELARIVGAAGGIYVTHVRYELGLVEALAEAFAIAAGAHAPVHVSHLRGEDDLTAVDVLRLVEEAAAGGVDVSYDVYPYARGSTFLPYLLPAWVMAGGVPEAAARLELESVREALRVELDPVVASWSFLTLAGDLSGEGASYSGVDVLTAAAAAGTEPVDFVCDLLLAQRFGSALIVHQPDEDEAERDVLEMLRHPLHVVGSDGIFTQGVVHPRGYGAFARMVGTLVRQDVTTLEDAVHRSSARTAARFGLGKRGLIRTGYAADLVLFDPDSVRDRATYEHGTALAAGVRDVFVNGVGVLRDGRPTGATPGRGIRGSGARPIGRHRQANDCRQPAGAKG